TAGDEVQRGGRQPRAHGELDEEGVQRVAELATVQHIAPAPQWQGTDQSPHRADRPVQPLHAAHGVEELQERSLGRPLTDRAPNLVSNLVPDI
ncbi:hypothetical protein ADK38_26585, partial [Streptomyces varsoviensis]